MKPSTPRSGRAQQSGAEQATTRKRGKRGTGRQQRREIQRVAQERQGAWLGKDQDGHVDTSPTPVRLRVADLTVELDELFEAKRVENRRAR